MKTVVCDVNRVVTEDVMLIAWLKKMWCEESTL